MRLWILLLVLVAPPGLSAAGDRPGGSEPQRPNSPEGACVIEGAQRLIVEESRRALERRLATLALHLQEAEMRIQALTRQLQMPKADVPAGPGAGPEGR